MQPLSEYPMSDSDNESGKNRSMFHRSVSMSTGAPWARNSNDGRVVMMRKRNNSSSEMSNGTRVSMHFIYKKKNIYFVIFYYK